MRKYRFLMSTLLLLAFFVIPATAQEMDLSQDDNVKANEEVLIEIDGNWHETDIYALNPTDPQAVPVPVGTLEWRITRQAVNLPNCILEACYQALPKGSSVSHLKFSSLKLGTGLDPDKYASLSAKTCKFSFPVVYGVVTVSNVRIPTSVNQVSLRATGVQVFEIDSGIWTLPQLKGALINVVSP